MSSIVTITVPKEYGYVILTAASTFLLSFWHGLRVAPFRRAARCAYPKPYAIASAGQELSKAEYLFNCAQRAHGNFMENHLVFVQALLIAGLKYPVVASVLGVGWAISRIVYALGYTRADKDKGQARLYGSSFWGFQFILIGMAAKVGWDMLA